MVLEIKNAVVVVVFIILKHNGLCGRQADSNYFYTKESIASTTFHVHIMSFACTLRAVVTVHAICEGLSIPDWKRAGRDKIQVFWLKVLTTMHDVSSTALRKGLFGWRNNYFSDEDAKSREGCKYLGMLELYGLLCKDMKSEVREAYHVAN